MQQQAELHHLHQSRFRQDAGSYRLTSFRVILRELAVAFPRHFTIVIGQIVVPWQAARCR